MKPELAWIHPVPALKTLCQAGGTGRHVLEGGAPRACAVTLWPEQGVGRLEGLWPGP